jgi:hypothetical protein
MTFPFPIFVPSRVERLYDRTTGINIGDMTEGGGLAAAFNGTTSEANSSCAVNSVGTTSYVGKTFAAASRISRIVVYGSNNEGFVNVESPTATLSIYGKQGSAPVSGTDGTLIGSISFTDTGNESAGREVQSSDKGTAYDHCWVHLFNGGSTRDMNIAELVIYVLL